MRLRSRVLGALTFLLFAGVPLLFLLSPPGSRPPHVPEIDWLYNALVPIAGEPAARVAWGIMCLVLAAYLLMPYRPPGPADARTDADALNEYVGELPPHEATIEPRPQRGPSEPAQ